MAVEAKANGFAVSVFASTFLPNVRSFPSPCVRRVRQSGAAGGRRGGGDDDWGGACGGDRGDPTDDGHCGGQCHYRYGRLSKP
jgi:hypothetical protein